MPFFGVLCPHLTKQKRKLMLQDEVGGGVEICPVTILMFDPYYILLYLLPH